MVGEYLEDKEYSGECVTSRICKIRVNVECLRYCFMEVIQTELDKIHVVQHWNLHAIRSQRHSDIPSGKHGLLYYVPEIFGGRDYGHGDLDNLEICLDLYSSPEKMYSEDIEELAHCLLP